MDLKPIWLMQPIPYMGENLTGKWIVEPKVDGWRLQIIKSKGKVEFWGRRLEKHPNWTPKLQYLATYLKDIPDGTLLDAELYTENGRRFIPSLFKKFPDVKPIIYIFDVIYFAYQEVHALKLGERKEILKDMALEGPFILMPYEALSGDVKNYLLRAKKEGYEGIVLKDWDSSYLIGRDGPMATIYWRKVK